VRAELETKLRSGESQREDLSRRVEDYFREITQLRERNQELETEMAKVVCGGCYWWTIKLFSCSESNPGPRKRVAHPYPDVGTV
jgi:hypothetical protein